MDKGTGRLYSCIVDKDRAPRRPSDLPASVLAGALVAARLHRVAQDAPRAVREPTGPDLRAMLAVQRHQIQRRGLA